MHAIGTRTCRRIKEFLPRVRAHHNFDADTFGCSLFLLGRVHVGAQRSIVTKATMQQQQQAAITGLDTALTSMMQLSNKEELGFLSQSRIFSLHFLGTEVG